MDDDRLREILDSPLDDEPRSGGRWVAGALGGVAAVVLVAVLVTRGDDSQQAPVVSDTEVAATTTADAPTTEHPPGEVGVPDARFGAQVVFHPPTGQLVMIGGGEPLDNGRIGGLAADTWTLETSEWVWRAHGPEGLPPRIGHAAAADGNSERIVVFGGSTEGPRICGMTGPCTGEGLDDTWLFDPATGTWEQTFPEVAPSPRYGTAMAFDEESGLMVLFGGGLRTAGFSNTTYADTWVFDSATTTWTEIETDVAPSARAWHHMAYDPGTDRIILLGGASRDELDAVAWSFDANTTTWEPLADEGPISRWGAAIAIDGSSRQLTVVGGQGAVVRQIGTAGTATEIRFLDEMWTYDLDSGTWEELNPLVGPVFWTSAAYDPATGRFVTTNAVLDIVTGEWILHGEDPG